jgi:outer membrane protein assembly factor BamB
MISKSIHVSILGVAVLFSAIVRAADWPAYKHDAARSSTSSEKVALPLSQQWSWQGAPPAPAWEEPGRSINPLDFDYAPQPVAASGLVFVASNADDTLRAFDAATGKIKWQYTANAPIRFAPQIDAGRCYFAADDGIIRCIDAATGTKVWDKRLALNSDTVIANGRLASRWPCRSGVLVRDGVVYTTAGMWPSEGVYIFALDAASGREIWCNDTSCYEYIEYPHVPSASFGGPAPQGQLLATSDTLLVPTGRGAPAGYDLKTGRLVQYTAGSEVGHKGGTNATVLGGTVFVTAVGWEPDVPPRLGESPDHFADSLVAFTARTGKEEWKPTAAMKEIAPEWKKPHWRGQIAAGLLGRPRAVVTANRVYAFGNGMADAWEINGNDAKLKWSKPRPRVYAEVLTANALLLGEDGRVVAIDPETGNELWQAPAKGQVRGLAVADGRIFVSTSTGALYTFAAGAAAAPSVPFVPESHAQEQVPGVVMSALGKMQNAGGFAVVAGGDNTSIAELIATSTKCHVLCLLSDPKAVDAGRARLLKSGQYGTRITVLAPESLKLPSYIASLVVISGDGGKLSPAESYRILRPAGGVLCWADAAAKVPPGVPAEEVQGNLVIRGRLKGAFDFDGAVEADERVRWPLEFTWFGGPNGQLQKARHTRPRTPLVGNGRIYVFGENTVVAVDAYNGTELWRRRFDGDIGKDAPAKADDRSLYVAVGSSVVRIDGATGKYVELFADKLQALPTLDASKPLHIDSAMRSGASGTIDISQTPEGLQIVLTSKSAAPQADDAWELAFDFRPAAKRLEAPGAGTFQIVMGADGVQRALPTFEHPSPKVQKLPDGRVSLTFAWGDLEKLVGSKPTDFLLAADLKLWNSKLDLTLWDRPLVTGRGHGPNDAEAAIVLGAKQKADDKILSPYLPIPVRSMGGCPLVVEKNKLAGLPLLAQRRANADLSDFGALAKPDKDPSATVLPRAKGFELPTRAEPFTGENNSLDYTPSYGCSGIISSAVMDFLRSGCIGMYDRLDDSGMRNISGIRSGCGQTLMPALGMLLYAEGTGNCLCTYNYATSFGMAPTGERRNEDWALFNEPQLNSAALKKIAFNFGAPGDRRDGDGNLWLTLPRPPLAVKFGTAVPVPATIDADAALGPKRINTDRHPIAGTDKAWLYGSNISGIRRFQLDLQYYKPGGTCLSVGSTAPKIDGELNDPCWDGFGGTPAGKEATMWLRHDAENLYIASRGNDGATKPLPFAIAFGDTSASRMVVLETAGGKLSVKQLDVPEFDRKAPASSLPDVPSKAIELPGAKLALRGHATEIAVPWKSLEAAGLKLEGLHASPAPAAFFGRKPNDVQRNFAKTSFQIRQMTDKVAPAKYTIRMHFAEIAGAKPGQRVFDVLLNGREVAKKIDVAAEAGEMKALVKEFRGVECGASLAVEFKPAGNAAGEQTAPLLSAIEVVRE